MMENSANKSDEKNLKISTLIFMDIEATGLPSFLGKKNVHITEITFIAIDRNDFENDKTQRVLNKLSLCVRPRAQISHGAMSITGLFNDMLENQELFDESIPQLLKYFFRRLKPPVCLLAHNGKRYDFPLLQAELKHINYALGPKVFCADTLEALRSIINSATVPKENKINNIISIPTELPNSKGEESFTIENQTNHHSEIKNAEPCNSAIITKNSIYDTSVNIFNGTTPIKSLSCDKDIEDLLAEDMDIFNDMDKKLNDIEFESSKSHCPNMTNGEESANKEVVNKDSIAYKNEHTPTGKATVPDDKGLKRRKEKISDPTFSPKRQNISNGFLPSEVKRKLFENGIDTKKSAISTTPQKMSFQLPKLYHHFFGEDPPQSHYAEADCIALSKVCQQVSSEFLQWIDANSFPFDEIDQMW